MHNGAVVDLSDAQDLANCFEVSVFVLLLNEFIVVLFNHRTYLKCESFEVVVKRSGSRKKFQVVEVRPKLLLLWL
jgi:hypothetical protein